MIKFMHLYFLTDTKQNKILIYSTWTCIFLISIVCSLSQNHYRIGETPVNGWEFVRDLFKENFDEERDLGASIAIYHQGKLVVDL
jgi:hypothetical protein